MKDTRLVYSVRGTWWDSIDKTGETSERGGISLPCCPHCDSVLFEMDEDSWWKSVQRYEDAGHPGYLEMTKWGRGKCFPNLTALELAYKNSQQ